jgi:putative acetyltransferase
MSAIITAASPGQPDAAQLIAELQAHLESFYPPESRHGFSVDRLIAEGVAFFVLRVAREAAGCGGIKKVDQEYGELKRMYVRPQFRGHGYGAMILNHLADYARSQGIVLLRLETGIHQQAAIRLYEQCGFRRIPPFGPYTDDPVSLCFEKRLT